MRSYSIAYSNHALIDYYAHEQSLLPLAIITALAIIRLFLYVTGLFLLRHRIASSPWQRHTVSRLY